MNWYSIKFTHEQIQDGSDKNLINEFSVLLRQLQKPEGLALFRDNHKLHHYQHYYMRIPDNFPFDALKIFSHNAAEVNRTFPPAIMMLEPIEGDYNF